MNIEEYIGKVISVKIFEKRSNWYIGKELNNGNNVYIEDTGDFSEDELIGEIEKCIIIRVEKNNLIGFILDNRKFLNDIKKIDRKLRQTGEYQNVKDIYLLERLKLKGKVVGLYLVDEEEIGKYYLDTVEIGTYVKKLRENNILFKENTVENLLAKQIKDTVQSIDLTKKQISLREEQNKQKDIIEKALGLEFDNSITRIATIDLKQKVRDVDEKNNERIKDIQGIQLRNDLENKKENTIDDVNVKQELETRDKLTDMKTLGQVLKKNGNLPEIEGKEFTKIGIIESYEMNNVINKDKEEIGSNTTRYAFVAIAKDNTVVPLNVEQDHQDGNNPTKLNYQVSQQGEVKEDAVLSRYKVGEGSLAIKNGQFGQIEVYHSPRKTIGGEGVEGNKSLDRQLETDNVWEMKKEERDLAGEFEDGYRSVEDGYQEARKHADKDGKIDAKDLQIEDIDGEENTKSHVHDNVNYEDLAVKWGYYKEGEPNTEKAMQLFEEKRKENPKKETKEIIDMVTDDLEEEMRNSRDSRY